MTMHGMFWDFPPDFSPGNTQGIRPLSSYLKIIPDFCQWQGYVVMACDDVSVFDNALVGQPQSNFWFVNRDELNSYGPRNASGGLWLNEAVRAFQNSEPFLVGGFDQAMVIIDGHGETGFTIQVEEQSSGSQNWNSVDRFVIDQEETYTQVLTLRSDQEWLRFSSDQDLTKLSIYLHLTQSDGQPKDPAIFESMSRIGESELKTGWLRPDGESGDLLIFGSKTEYFYRLNEKLQYNYQAHNETSLEIRNQLISNQSRIRYDSASVIYIDPQGMRWRLPWGTGGYDPWFSRFPHRKVREVATERSLLNAGGIFYELPREISGGIQRVKPIATHNCMIMDFCGWRGLMVMSGTRPGTQNSENYYFDKRIGAGLWVGTIDDLWNFEAPNGMGGMWNYDYVNADHFSDPYLMYGFKNKSLFLDHNSDKNVTFDVEIDFYGNGEFSPFRSVEVNSGDSYTLEFEAGFVAHWIRVKTNTDCQATAWLTYY